MFKNPDINSAVVRDAPSNQWLSFRHPLSIFTTHHLNEVRPLLIAMEREIQEKGLWAVGFINYEAAPAFDPALKTKNPTEFPLLWFASYKSPELIPDASFTQSPKDYQMNWKSSLKQGEYQHAIARIKQYIRSGDTYQVNYSFRLQATFHQEPWPFFTQLIRVQGNTYGAYLNLPDWSICSASPELFFQLNGHDLVSKPMKGTMPRGLWFEDDQNKASELHHSEKNRAENVMIVDMMRNDVGRIAEAGSVNVPSLFDIEQYPTLWQMTSKVSGTTKAGIAEIFRALFPPASITGAPKSRTMEIIAELEKNPRNIYTGTIGFIAPDRRAQFNVAIRTVLVNKRENVAEYGTGGGIVWDSTPASEFRECQTKARLLTHAYPEFSLLESLLWSPENGFYLLEGHLERLRKSATYFGFPLDIEGIRILLTESTRALAPLDHKVRLLVPEHKSPVIETRPLQSRQGSYHVCLAKEPVDSTNPFLYHKTTLRDVYDQRLKSHPESHDVLLWNEKGEITESCSANVIFEMEGQWFTPPIICGLLPGVYRSCLLEQGKLKERKIGVDEIDKCTRLMLANSVRREWDVILRANQDLPV